MPALEEAGSLGITVRKIIPRIILTIFYDFRQVFPLHSVLQLRNWLVKREMFAEFYIPITNMIDQYIQNKVNHKIYLVNFTSFSNFGVSLAW